MPSQEYLKSLFEYDPATGNGFWKKRLSNRIKVGDAISSVDRRFKYKRVCIDGVSYGWHRIAYKIYHGDFDESLQIDHINGVENGDGIENLRAVTHSENQKNQKRRKTNTSGHNGVSWNKEKKSWNAYLMVNFFKKNLGYFKDIEDAVKARAEANVKYAFAKGHGERVSG